ncbi:TonB-dependent receptor [candidate division KSB1 bacterium]|nr:MAG: TonB-dependent receptor [candidate division KSB1 bacterium]
MIFHKQKISLLITFSLLLGISSLMAENRNLTSGSLRGHVVDAVTNEELAGASVSVEGTTLGAATDAEGRFNITEIPVGIYRVRGSYLGYNTLLKTDIVIRSGQQTEIMLMMQPSPLNLPEVVITPSYFEERSAAPVSTQSFSNEEIRRAPGGNEDVVRAVSVLPGVVQAQAGRNDLVVRGGAPSENLYVIDHLEVPNINHFGTQGAGGGPLSFVNLDYVRDVDFSTGGFGVPYGDKLSSAMNIQLKEGRTDRFGGKATISASQFGLNADGPLGKNGSALFSVRRSYLDFFFKSAGFSFVPEYWDFLGKTTHRLSPHDELSVLAIGTVDDVRFFNDSPEKRFDNSRILGTSQDQYFSNIYWKHLFHGGFLTTSLGRTYTSFDYRQADSLLAPIFTSQSREGQTSLRSDVVWMFNRKTELSLGVQAKAARLKGSLYLASIQTSLGDSLASSRDWDAMAFKSAAYVQASHPLSPRFRLTAGLRLDFFDRISKQTALAPRFSANYQLTNNTSLNLSAGSYYQAPSYIWLMSNGANRGLAFLRADQAVLGIEQLLRPDMRVRVEGYMKSYRDYPASVTRPYLVLSNTGGGFGGSEEGFSSFGFDPLVSKGKGFSRGVELLIQKRFSDLCCYGITSASYTQTDFEALDGMSRPGLYDQRLIFNLSGGYIPNNKWEFSLKFRVGTGTPYTPFDSDGTQNIAAYASERLPTFHALDLRADRRWNFLRWNLITYLDIQNVYNHQNIQGYRWDERERKVVTDTDIGILPSLGISAEF